MSEPGPPVPFFLIVAGYDTGLFCIEGPMTDDTPWNFAAGHAPETRRRVQCGPSSADRAALAEKFQPAHKMGGVLPDSIVRPRG